MPAPILHLGATVLLHACRPGDAGRAVPARARVSGQPVVTLTSPYAIAGCALTGTPTPPCVTGAVDRRRRRACSPAARRSRP